MSTFIELTVKTVIMVKILNKKGSFSYVRNSLYKNLLCLIINYSRDDFFMMPVFDFWLFNNIISCSVSGVV